MLVVIVSYTRQDRVVKSRGRCPLFLLYQGFRHQGSLETQRAAASLLCMSDNFVVYIIRQSVNQSQSCLLNVLGIQCGKRSKQLVWTNSSVRPVIPLEGGG